MKRFIARWHARLVFYTWLCRIMWRKVTGRWFILRDAPDFVVFALAALEPEQMKGEAAVAIVQEAHQEARLRIIREVQQLRRTLDRVMEVQWP